MPQDRAAAANDMQIYPTITTITPGAWLQKMTEVKKLKLKEVCLFLTCLDQEQRKKLYALLKETNVKEVPFVHLRSDMELWELDYLAKNYHTKFFNTHTKREYRQLRGCDQYKKSIYIENVSNPFDEEEIKEFGGVCLDFSHLENDRILHQETYQININVLEKYPPQCSHISAIKKETFIDELSRVSVTNHRLESLSELDYLKKYPLRYFGAVAAIELENTIKEQLEAQTYIRALIENK